ncbi:hypothetical protein NK718_12250 [Alsobacter sp. SYSU M60028]|uniref:XRE family transcriptional regulator n=1 Tax=Alsobacter ponti TaxID=2962936 RepID=A0ABT1LCV0_9HYPH|nr:hypothetical protein [Alsobacter ponti]MCP8939289.1 hypothetical protein [Alsobacter ponti]
MDYTMQIINNEGVVVDSFTDDDIFEENGSYYRLMEDIHELARRRAMGSDAVLDEVLKELDDDLPF